MGKRVNVPRLRFPEFEDEWDEKSFDTLFKTSPSKKYQINANEIEDIGLVPVVTQGKEKISGFSNETTKTCKLAPIIVFGDHTTNLKLIKEDFIIGGDGIKLLNPKEGDIDYLFHALEYYNIKPEGYKRHFSILKEISLPIPSITEQKKIGKFLTAIDEKIDLLTRSYEQLKLYKQEIMRRLFTQELRFPEFKDEWETVHIKDIAEIVGGGTPSTENPEYWNGNINWFTPIEIGENKYIKESERKITEKGFQNSSTKLIPKNSILLSSRASIGKISINLEDTTTNQGFQSLIPKNINHEFLYYSIGFNKQEFVKKATGTTFLEISKKEVSNIKLKIPSLKEQEKIADFLTSLDKKIELQEQQLEQTKQFKKAMLQQLFP